MDAQALHLVLKILGQIPPVRGQIQDAGPVFLQDGAHQLPRHTGLIGDDLALVEELFDDEAGPLAPILAEAMVAIEFLLERMHLTDGAFREARDALRQLVRSLEVIGQHGAHKAARRLVKALFQQLSRKAIGVAAEEDVHAAAGHVGGDGHRAGPARLGNDKGLLLVQLGIEHIVLDAPLAQHPAEHLRSLHRRRAHEHRLALLVQRLDLLHHRVELGLGRLVDHVGCILADHRLVGGEHHHIQAVDAVELFLLRSRRAGHPRQPLVHAEIVLKGDRGHGEALALDAHALLGLDGLMQALGVAPTVHEAAGELVHDDHLAVLHHVIVVFLEKDLGLEGILQVGGQLEMLRRIEVINPQGALDLLDPCLGEGHDALFNLDGVIVLLAQVAHQGREALIVAGRLLRLAGDDQRRARLVYEDVIHLIHDGIV